MGSIGPGWARPKQNCKSNRRVFRIHKATSCALSSVALRRCADLLGERLAPEFVLLPCPGVAKRKDNSNRRIFRTKKATNQALSFVVLHSCAEYGRVELAARKYQAGVSQENGVIKKITLPDSHFQSRPHTCTYTHRHTHLQTHTHTQCHPKHTHKLTRTHTHIWMPRVKHIVTPFD